MVNSNINNWIIGLTSILTIIRLMNKTLIISLGIDLDIILIIGYFYILYLVLTKKLI